jgi:type IV secretion system protein VirB1
MLPVASIDTLAQQCAPGVHRITVQAVVRQESGGNPFAIGVVGGQLVRQPRNLAEAVATARKLEADGRNYSVGLAQINRSNFARLGLTPDSAFEACANLAAMQSVLVECWNRAVNQREAAQPRWAIEASFACYYSGTFAVARHSGYVNSVVANARSARVALASAAAGGIPTERPPRAPAGEPA